jgi:hypothetical protein
MTKPVRRAAKKTEIENSIFPQKHLSKQGDGILPYKRIGRGERQTMSLCLTNQHAIEGIAMQRRQIAQVRDSSFIHRQRRDHMFFALKRDKLRGWLRQGKFAKAIF